MIGKANVVQINLSDEKPSNIFLVVLSAFAGEVVASQRGNYIPTAIFSWYTALKSNLKPQVRSIVIMLLYLVCLELVR
jgi:hypothetical protein